MARYKDSFEEFIGFSRSMDRMLSSILLPEQGQAPSFWRPPTDVYETNDNVVILIEVAGMNPDQFHVEYSNKILRVSGQRQDKHLRAMCHCLEVQYGEFASEVYLPGAYDVDAIDAEYKDGFLTITLPKVQETAKLIPVQTNESRRQSHTKKQ